MTRCKHNKTGFGMCKDCMKLIKETEAKMKIDKKIEKIIINFNKIFPSKNLKTVGGYEFYPNPDKRDMENFLRQTLLEYREEIIKDYEKELEKLREKSWKYDELKKIAENY